MRILATTPQPHDHRHFSNVLPCARSIKNGPTALKSVVEDFELGLLKTVNHVSWWQMLGIVQLNLQPSIFLDGDPLQRIYHGIDDCT
jgi:hypothetical protein